MSKPGLESFRSMWSRLQAYFTPSESQEHGFRSALLIKILLVTLCGSLGALVIFLSQLIIQGTYSPYRDMLAVAGFSILNAFSLYLNKSGRGRFARWLYIGSLLLLVTMVGYLEGHPQDDPFLVIGFVMVMLFSLAVLEPLPVWLVVGLSTTAYGLLHLIWLGGWLPPAPQRNPGFDSILLVFVWLLCAVILVLLFQNLFTGFRDQSEILEKQVYERTQSLETLAEEKSIMNRAMLNMLEDLEESNLQLQEQKEELAIVNRELSSFSYSVSHDLRAPLRAMDGFSRILVDDFSKQLPSDAVRFLALIRKNAQQMGMLIDDLLAYSRSSRVEVRRGLTEPMEIVRDVWDELVSDRIEENINMVLYNLPKCYADSVLLRQVYQNLLDNALKYSSNRERIEIEVGYSAIAGGESSVYYVRDNGIGFNMQYSDKLFTVFQRLHSSEAYEGTGVGLAIVSRIINRHGGRVWAESEEGQGAIFYFTLGRDALNE